MQISVIIPVFNTVLKLSLAVYSVIEQEEVLEIILVEDKSTDDSLVLCQSLERQHEKVKLYRHEDKGNHGAAETRNLGIKKAKGDYIAFLDADDYYLPSRFNHSLKALNENHELDGIYEPVKVTYENKAAQKKYSYRSGKPDQIMFKRDSRKQYPIISYLKGKNGWIHLNGLTIRKKSLGKIGLFDPDFRLAQDTDFILRCLYYGNFISGNEKEVAVRTIHRDNRVHNWKKTALTINQLKRKWYQWSIGEKSVPPEIKKVIKNWVRRPARLEAFYLRGWKNVIYRNLEIWKSG